jgi:hypothetical protein
MTATQVYTRFLKEIGCYSLIYPCIKEAAQKRRVYEDNYDKLKSMHGDKALLVDRLLKNCRYSLFNLTYLLIYSRTFATKGYFKLVDKKWRDYLRKNIKGNYFKTMIPDSEQEVTIERHWGGRYRNGYHSLDFSFKEKKNDSCD